MVVVEPSEFFRSVFVPEVSPLGLRYLVSFVPSELVRFVSVPVVFPEESRCVVVLSANAGDRDSITIIASMIVFIVSPPRSAC